MRRDENDVVPDGNSFTRVGYPRAYRVRQYAREIAADADLLSSAKRKLVPKRPPSPGDIHDVTRRARNPSQRGIRYRMLKYGQEYVDKGTEYYEQRYRQQQILLLQKKAAKLGLQITVAHS
jgi:hypothetical protein